MYGNGEVSERVSSGHDTPHATIAVLTHTRAMLRPHTRARRIVNAAGVSAAVAVPMLPLLFFGMAVHYRRRAYVNKHAWEW